MPLVGLKGVAKYETECEFFTKPSDIKRILAGGIAATSAGGNGAINVYTDDEGMIRCEAMRYRETLEEKEYATIEAAAHWSRKWLKIINQ